MPWIACLDFLDQAARSFVIAHALVNLDQVDQVLDIVRRAHANAFAEIGAAIKAGLAE